MSDPSKHGRKSIVVVEDHPVFCDGLVALINGTPDLYVCGTAATGAAAMQKVPRLRPSLVILDLYLPDANGLGLIGRIAEASPGVEILILSMADESAHAREALRLGARGYLMKHESPQRLLDGMREVLKGRTCVSSRVTSQVLHTLRSTHRVGSENLLSARERAVLELIGQGETSAAIAQHLRISIKTVSCYRTHIREKMGFASAHELLCFAIRRSSVKPAFNGND